DEPEVSLVLLDLALPGTRGLDLLADLMQDYPGVPVVVLSATHDRATVNAAFAAGARGFIAKTSDPRELLEAVRLVCEGGEYLTPHIARARADQVATLYASWHRTTASMTLGAAILCIVLWDREDATTMALWFAAILANQAWRGVLARAWRRTRPVIADAPRWGRYWSAGSAIAGALWGTAAIVMFPASPPHQALLIVCLFSVVLGGLNLTAVYKPSFYGFVLAALMPLIARVAIEGGQVHVFTALVLFVVLVFVMSFGRQVNGLLTHSLAIRYE